MRNKIAAWLKNVCVCVCVCRICCVIWMSWPNIYNLLYNANNIPAIREGRKEQTEIVYDLTILRCKRNSHANKLNSLDVCECSYKFCLRFIEKKTKLTSMRSATSDANAAIILVHIQRLPIILFPIRLQMFASINENGI